MIVVEKISRYVDGTRVAVEVRLAADLAAQAPCGIGADRMNKPGSFVEPFRNRTAVAEPVRVLIGVVAGITGACRNEFDAVCRLRGRNRRNRVRLAHEPGGHGRTAG
jgi:hypothetical protein